MPGFVIQRMATTTTTSSNIQIQIQILNLDTYCLIWTFFSERKKFRFCFNISKMFLVFNIFLPISLIVRREDDGPDMFGGNIGRRCWLMTGGNMFCISSRYLPDTFPCLICFSHWTKIWQIIFNSLFTLYTFTFFSTSGPGSKQSIPRYSCFILSYCTVTLSLSFN